MYEYRAVMSIHDQKMAKYRDEVERARIGSESRANRGSVVERMIAVARERKSSARRSAELAAG